MQSTSIPEHTCYGAIFCGRPRATAQAECPVCTPIVIVVEDPRLAP